MSAKDYFGIQNQKEELFKEAIEAFKRLEARYNPIVLEGAGSISELNLRDRDITNMRMAIAAGASTYLVADIDRGGVFGSVYGTIALLRPEERVLMKGLSSISSVETLFIRRRTEPIKGIDWDSRGRRNSMVSGYQDRGRGFRSVGYEK